MKRFRRISIGIMFQIVWFSILGTMVRAEVPILVQVEEPILAQVEEPILAQVVETILVQVVEQTKVPAVVWILEQWMVYGVAVAMLVLLLC